MQQPADCSVPDWSAGLTADLWMDILSRLAGRSTEGLSPLSINECVEKQKHHEHMRLVCRRFRDVLQQDQQRSQQMVLSRDFDSQSLLSFEPWLTRHGTAVQTLVSDSATSFQEAAFRLVSIHSPTLVKAYLKSCSAASVGLLSLFRNVSVCEIQTGVSVGALQSVQSLRSLTLRGELTASQLPPHLTELKVTHGFLITG